MQFSWADSGTPQTVTAEMLIVPDAGRDTFLFQGLDSLLTGDGKHHVFGADGHSRLVEVVVSDDLTVCSTNVTQQIDDDAANRATGYFPFQQPFVARVYPELAVLQTSTSADDLYVYGTNGGDLVMFYKGDDTLWHAANLSNDTTIDTDQS